MMPLNVLNRKAKVDHLWIKIKTKGHTSTSTAPKQPEIAALSSAIQNIDLNYGMTSESGPPTSLQKPQFRRKTIEEVKQLLGEKLCSSVSFVIIGDMILRLYLLFV